MLKDISKIKFTGTPAEGENLDPKYDEKDVIGSDSLHFLGAIDLVQVNVEYISDEDNLKGKIGIAIIGVNSQGRLMTMPHDKFIPGCPPDCKDKDRASLITFDDALHEIKNA
ncbi:MAG: hypothetical protein MI974_12065 [Chitinophagales bacterium]|nr:hypothetical protein [Chitinophagales bacterium]